MTHPRAPARVAAAPERRPPARAPAPASQAVVAVSAARALQRRVGNQGTQALVRQRAAAGVALRGAARVSSPGEPAELEAEATAKKVMRSTAAPTVSSGASGIARKAGDPPALSPNTSASIASSTGSGAPLPARVRNFMEPRFKADFSRVRIHTGQPAAQLSAQLHAQAFTVGNNIFFGKDQFKPDSPEGQELIAHELTHTIQQGAAVQRSAAPGIASRSSGELQRGWLPSPLEYAADKANLLPGFRMLTIILGFNPITMGKVDRGAANVLRALLELLPGGALLTDALNNSGVFDKVGGWIEQRLATLGMAAGTLKGAIDAFIASLDPGDLLDLGGVWERAKRIFTAPIDRIIAFGKTLLADVIQFVKDALLLPLAKLAEKLPSWPLLTAVLGKNPISGEAVPRTADTLVGGFLKLIGQEEVWANMQKANAVARVWVWFQGALATVLGFVGQLPALAMSALKALTLEDIVLLPRAFVKIGAVFGSFVGQFITWAGNALWTLLEIVADAISPGAFGYIKKTGAALKSILKNPLPFVGNLVKAAKQGFLNFAGNFLGHLKAGLMDWLLGALPGVYVPKAFSLGEIVKFAFSVLGISWQNIRQKLVKVVGEPAVAAMEAGFDIVKTLVTQGPAAAWDKIKEQLAELQEKVVGGIVDFVVDMVVKKAVPKLVAMFIPGAGFISAIMSIYETVMVFVEKIAKIVQVVKGFIDSIVAIAGGAIGAAASKVEGILAGLLSLAINFLAGFIGLGKVADKVMGVIGKVRATIDKALDALINWIVKMAKKLFAKVFGKKDAKGAGGKNDPNALRDVDVPLRFADEMHTTRAHVANNKVVFLMASGTFSDMRQKLGALSKSYSMPFRDVGMNEVADDIDKKIEPVKKIVESGESAASARLVGVTDVFKRQSILNEEAKKTSGQVSAALEKMRAQLTSGKLGKAIMGPASKIKPGDAIVMINPERAMIVRTVKVLSKIQDQYEFILNAEAPDGTFKTPLLYRQEGVTWGLANKPVHEPFKPSGLGGYVVIDAAHLNSGSTASYDPPFLKQTIAGRSYAIRGHLVAVVFGGPGGKNNIVALTAAANERMRSQIEVPMSKEIKAQGSVYRYSVRPVHLMGSTSQPVASVEIEAIRIYPNKTPKKTGHPPVTND